MSWGVYYIWNSYFAPFSAFFFAILYILSQLGKKYAYFFPIGEKFAFSSCFYPFSIIFFPQPVIWPYFPPPRGGGQTEKYTPLSMSQPCQSCQPYVLNKIFTYYYLLCFRFLSAQKESFTCEKIKIKRFYNRYLLFWKQRLLRC